MTKREAPKTVAEVLAAELAILARRRMNSARRRGEAFEVEVMHDLEARGWIGNRLRQGGGCVIDIIAFDTLGVAQLIQCKLNGYMRPAERDELRKEADARRAIPLMAYKICKSIIYKEVTE